MGDILLIISGVFLVLASLYLLYRPVLSSAIPAYISLWMFYIANEVTFSNKFLITWGTITLCITLIERLDKTIQHLSPILNLYMILGAAAGMLIGMTSSEFWLIPGAGIGAAIGLLAFAKTPGGKNMLFSGSTFIQYFCRYGFRIVVTISMLGLLIGALVVRYRTEQILNI